MEGINFQKIVLHLALVIIPGLFSFNVSAQSKPKKCRFDHYDRFEPWTNLHFPECDKKRIASTTGDPYFDFKKHSPKLYVRGKRMSDGKYQFHFQHGFRRTKKFSEDMLDWEIGKLFLGKYNRELHLKKR